MASAAASSSRPSVGALRPAQSRGDAYPQAYVHTGPDAAPHQAADERRHAAVRDARELGLTNTPQFRPAAARAVYSSSSDSSSDDDEADRRRRSDRRRPPPVDRYVPASPSSRPAAASDPMEIDEEEEEDKHVAVDHDLAVDSASSTGKCSACHCFVFEAIGWSCGHTVCKKCHDQMKSLGCNKKCPDCRVTGVATPQPSIDRMIEQIKVNCPAAPCDATYPLGIKFRNVAAHEAVCPYHIVPCSDCGCNVPQKDMQPHKLHACPMRKVGCVECGMDVLVSEMEAHAKSDDNDGWDHCKGFVQCPNGCCPLETDEPNKKKRKSILDAASKGQFVEGGLQPQHVIPTVLRIKDLDDHLKVCPRANVKCAVCGDSYRRMKENEHYRTERTKHDKALLAAAAMRTSISEPSVPETLVASETFDIYKDDPRGGNMNLFEEAGLLYPSRKLEICIRTVNVHGGSLGQQHVSLELAFKKMPMSRDMPVSLDHVYRVSMQLLPWSVNAAAVASFDATFHVTRSVSTATFKAFPVSLFDRDNPALLNADDKFSLRVQLWKRDS